MKLSEFFPSIAPLMNAETSTLKATELYAIVKGIVALKNDFNLPLDVTRLEAGLPELKDMVRLYMLKTIIDKDVKGKE